MYKITFKLTGNTLEVNNITTVVKLLDTDNFTKLTDNNIFELINYKKTETLLYTIEII